MTRLQYHLDTFPCATPGCRRRVLETPDEPAFDLYHPMHCHRCREEMKALQATRGYRQELEALAEPVRVCYVSADELRHYARARRSRSLLRWLLLSGLGWLMLWLMAPGGRF